MKEIRMRYLFSVALFLLANPVLASSSSPASQLTFVNILSALTKESEQNIETIAAHMRDNPDLEVWIDGYGDLAYPPTYNQILGRNRMLQAFLSLTRAGVPHTRIVLNNKGKIPEAQKSDPSSRLLSLTYKKSNKPASSDKVIAPNNSGTKQYAFTLPPNSSRFSAIDSPELFTFLGAYIGDETARISVISLPSRHKEELFAVPMQRLRALATYEKLVRAGFPAKRIDLPMPEEKIENDQALDVKSQRRVVLSWKEVSPAKTVETVVVAEKTTPTPPVEQDKTEPTPPPVVQEEVASPPQQESETLKKHEAFVAAGVLIPSGKMASVAKGTPTFGLGIRGQFLPAMNWRAEVSRQKFLPKSSDQEGDLTMTTVNLGVEAFHDIKWTRLYSGAHLGAHFWRGKITEISSGDNNEKSSNDLGLALTLGASFSVTSNLSLGPDILYHMVSGKFNGSYAVPALLLGWRF